MAWAICNNAPLTLLTAVCWLTSALAAVAAETAAVAQGTDNIQQLVGPATQSHGESVAMPIMSAKLFRHADRVIARFDTDGSGQLEQPEWAAAEAALSLELERLDTDGDGLISPLELAEYIAAYGQHRVLEPVVRTRQTAPQPPPLLNPSTPGASAQAGSLPPNAEPGQPSNGLQAARNAGGSSARQPAKKFHVSPSRLPPGLPDWFLARDADGDGQLDFAEFAPQGGQWALEQFRRYDLNEDGLIMPQEVLGAKHSPGIDKSGPP